MRAPLSLFHPACYFRCTLCHLRSTTTFISPVSLCAFYTYVLQVSGLPPFLLRYSCRYFVVCLCVHVQVCKPMDMWTVIHRRYLLQFMGAVYSFHWHFPESQFTSVLPKKRGDRDLSTYLFLGEMMFLHLNLAVPPYLYERLNLSLFYCLCLHSLFQLLDRKTLPKFRVHSWQWQRLKR